MNALLFVNKVRTFSTLIVLLFLTGIVIVSCNDNKQDKVNQQKTNETVNQNHEGMTNHMKMKHDERISLNLSPQKAQHQLMNMRSHVIAVQSIITLLAKNEFEKASEVAHQELGLTDEMKKMCTSFSNPEFVTLGLDFHKSADKLGEVLKTKDKDKSLQALSTTMNFCISCHETFRQ